ncbi:hypothetical protein KSP40_PGU010642 [Platanthera guangdongensis]|uniref:Uncharacterized protein n=1 Tax=Platanthera guangdongensis TaxID=2320717 RepID=A0ABR2N544_9ASPA
MVGEPAASGLRVWQKKITTSDSQRSGRQLRARLPPTARGSSVGHADEPRAVDGWRARSLRPPHCESERMRSRVHVAGDSAGRGGFRHVCHCWQELLLAGFRNDERSMEARVDVQEDYCWQELLLAGLQDWRGWRDSRIAGSLVSIRATPTHRYSPKIAPVCFLGFENRLAGIFLPRHPCTVDFFLPAPRKEVDDGDADVSILPSSSSSASRNEMVTGDMSAAAAAVFAASSAPPLAAVARVVGSMEAAVYRPVGTTAV